MEFFQLHRRSLACLLLFSSLRQKNSIPLRENGVTIHLHKPYARLISLKVLMEGLMPNKNVFEFKEGSQQEFEKRM
jgi:hypothetical protein